MSTNSHTPNTAEVGKRCLKRLLRRIHDSTTSETYLKDFLKRDKFTLLCLLAEHGTLEDTKHVLEDLKITLTAQELLLCLNNPSTTDTSDHSSLNFPIYDIITNEHVFMFLLGVEYQRLDIIKYLHKDYGLSYDKKNAIFVYGAVTNHTIEVLEYLIHEMEFVVPLNEDPEYQGHDILSVMALNGSIELLKWLLGEKRDNLGKRVRKALEARKEKVLQYAYEARNLDMVKYLMEEYDSTVGEGCYY